MPINVEAEASEGGGGGGGGGFTFDGTTAVYQYHVDTAVWEILGDPQTWITTVGGESDPLVIQPGLYAITLQGQCTDIGRVQLSTNYGQIGDRTEAAQYLEPSGSIYFPVQTNIPSLTGTSISGNAVRIDLQRIGG